MYRIYADNLCIFDDTLPEQQHMAVSPKLTLTAGAAGSLTFTLPKGCTGYDTVQKLTTTIRVERDFDIIWMGRVLTEKIDLWGNRELFCEGALAFLNDTIPMVTNPTLSSVLTAHNGKVAANRQIALGNVAQAYAGGTDAEADGSTSLEIVNSKLVGSLGGILQLRYPSDTPTLDWLAAYPTNVNAQKLEFGKNLLDFTRNWDLSEYSTYCYVQGAEYETTVNDQTVKQNYNSGWQYITPQSGTAPKDLYGRIEKYLNYSDLQSDADCVAEAQKYLATQQFDNMMIELTALDLHIIDPAIRPFNLLEIVSVSSWAHGMAPQNFAVTAMDIPLDAPENTRYTLANATLAYTRKVRTITKVTQQNLSESMDYTDAAAEEGIRYTDREITDAKEWVENNSELKQEQDRIYMAVTKEVGGGVREYVQSATVEMTANQIKQRVSETTTDPQTGEPVTVWTVANLKPDGFHVADQSGVTKITGSMIDVDTIHVNTLYGQTISLVYVSGDQIIPVGSLIVSKIGNERYMEFDFERVYLHNVPNVVFSSPGTIYFDSLGKTLQTLLDEKANVPT